MADSVEAPPSYQQAASSTATAAIPTAATSTNNTTSLKPPSAYPSIAYNISKTAFSNFKLTLSPASPSSQPPSAPHTNPHAHPSLVLETALYKPHKPDIALYALPSDGHNATKEKVLLGTVDLGRFSGRYNVALAGLNDKEAGGTSVELKKVRGWISRHSFEYALAPSASGVVNGSGRKPVGGAQLRRFTWRHPGEKMVERAGDLELVEGEMNEGEDDEGEDEEEFDEEEEMRRWERMNGRERVLARYFAEGGGDEKDKGRRDKGRLVVEAGGEEGFEGEEWGRLVVLTAMALVVLRRREQ